MKYLEIKEISIKIEDQYLPAKYPSPGLYLNSITSQYLLFKDNIILYIGTMGGVEIKELAAEAPRTSISEDFVLRALAIAQQPELSTRLLK